MGGVGPPAVGVGGLGPGADEDQGDVGVAGAAGVMEVVLRPSISISISYISKTQTIGKTRSPKKIYKKAKGKTFNQKVQKKNTRFPKTANNKKKESLSVIWKRE